jgi:hypothetical protein
MMISGPIPEGSPRVIPIKGTPSTSSPPFINPPARNRITTVKAKIMSIKIRMKVNLLLSVFLYTLSIEFENP